MNKINAPTQSLVNMGRLNNLHQSHRPLNGHS
jgi:hypothetical protein